MQSSRIELDHRSSEAYVLFEQTYAISSMIVLSSENDDHPNVELLHFEFKNILTGMKQLLLKLQNLDDNRTNLIDVSEVSLTFKHLTLTQKLVENAINNHEEIIDCRHKPHAMLLTSLYGIQTILNNAIAELGSLLKPPAKAA